MNRRTFTAIPSTFRKVFTLLIMLGLLGSCKKDDSLRKNGPLAGGYSIIVNNGNVLVSGFKSENGVISPKYWINGESTDQSKFNELLGNQSTYRQAIDEKYRTGYTYKDRNGTTLGYRFDQGSGVEGGRMFYYKDESIVRINSDSIGVISSVAFHEDKPVFAGTLGKMLPGISGNLIYNPKTAFIWDGDGSLKKLVPPVRSTLFWGVSTIYSYNPDEIYVGGLCGMPMYWKNTDPVVLDERFGEVLQITKSGSDVYAVGLINKYNSNSTAHTACYWKNGSLHELQDNAQAYGIFIDGKDIYVTGAVGNVPAAYRPCYWKNGVRVDLPM